jgi:broad specificity phosphatase PhoE
MHRQSFRVVSITASSFVAHARVRVVVLVVAHNGVNRFFMADQLGMPLKNYRRIVQDNSALTMVTLDKTDGFKLLKLNA